MKPVNLIPASRQLANQRRKCIRRWIVACAAYAVLLVVAYGAMQLTWLPGDEGVRAAPERLKKVRLANTETDKTVKDIQAQLQQARRTLDANRSVVDKPDWSLLMVLLTRTLQDEIVLRRCNLVPMVAPPIPAAIAVAPAPAATPGARPAIQSAANKAEPPPNVQQYTLLLGGLGKSQSAVAQFVVRLEQTGLFDEVKLIAATREPFLSNEAVGFRLECRMSEGRSGS